MIVSQEEYRGLLIVGDGTYGHKIIKAIGKGSIPTDLLGSFTTSRMAKIAIDRVKNMKPLNTRKANGTKTSTK